MERIERSRQKYAELFGDMTASGSETDPDFARILRDFVYGDVYFHGSLDDRQRELITLVVLVTNHTLTQLREHVGAALTVGVTPVEIKEALYHCAPYVGFPKVLDALDQANQVFAERDISLPLASQTRVAEHERFEKGLNVQMAMFGDTIRQMQQSAPENQKHIQRYLSEFCFGDTYTRGGLDLKTRELLTLCIISALGGCEPQLRGHVQGNLNVGNDKDMVVEAITQCLPYIGFPRTLNALSCVNNQC